MVDHNFMKRMAPFLVLEILKNHTDNEHGLKVTQIAKLLTEDYNVSMERKSVSRILNDIWELSEIPEEYDWKNPMPYSIKFDEIPRSNGNIRENWRLCKNFEDAEVQLLMDLLMSVEGYPQLRLMEKLQKLGGFSLQSRSIIRENKDSVNYQMPSNMTYIEKTIRNNRKMAFRYENDDYWYTVSPYKQAFHKGNYYLICYDEDKEDMALFRVEKIKNAVPLEEPAKDCRTVSALARWNYSVDAYLEHYIFGNLEN